MADESVLLSIVVPAYNHAAFLPRALDSVLCQKGDYEVIIVDDGSTDTTPEICERYQVVDRDRVRHLRQANAGPSSARNNGLRVSSGSYVLFLDADDALEDGAILALERRLRQRHPPAGLVVFGHTSIRPGGRRVSRPREELPTDAEARFRDYVGGRFSLRPSCVVFHRAVFDGLSFPEGIRHAEDQVLFGVALANYSCEVIRTPLVMVYQQDSSLGRNLDVARQVGFACVDLLFAHPLLPKSFRRYRGRYLARRALSLFRHHARHGRARGALRFFGIGLFADPSQAIRRRNLRKLVGLLRFW